ncbi:hypothetical protein ANCCAN_08741 [Ancylostoma caninum]|uniref:Uncharacterized protein n=1 Tax=Ancylostoma caninum TaxID=29170 RepID=A0A368GLI5_ANCCA|nr:hypothetical protein ANCCAN_08741 [Ancylostoma caninum]
MKEIRNSVQLLMTIVDNADFIHPNFTTFIYLEDNVKNLKVWAEFIFQLSLSTRRRHFGILYHVRKRIAPFCYASGITECSLEELKIVIADNAKDITYGSVTGSRRNTKLVSASSDYCMS